MAQADGPRWTVEANSFQQTTIADSLRWTGQPSASVGQPRKTAPASAGRPPLPAVGGRLAPPSAGHGGRRTAPKADVRGIVRRIWTSGGRGLGRPNT
jgi:hypothetical protein